MVETVIEKRGEKSVQVRSRLGRVLFEKTKKGYSIQCPDSQETYLIPYERMVLEYLTMGDEDAQMILSEEERNQ